MCGCIMYCLGKWLLIFQSGSSQRQSSSPDTMVNGSNVTGILRRGDESLEQLFRLAFIVQGIVGGSLPLLSNGLLLLAIKAQVGISLSAPTLYSYVDAETGQSNRGKAPSEEAVLSSTADCPTSFSEIGDMWSVFKEVFMVSIWPLNYRPF